MTSRLRRLLGASAVFETDDGRVEVRPSSAAACAAVLRLASGEGWRVAIAGSNTWISVPAGADLVLRTGGLADIGPIDPADLVATASAGAPWSALTRRLADHGMWLAQDHPGGDRSVGSVLATGTTGPLRAGFGALRDQVLGLTLVTGDGRILELGGRVVKNVAGYDIGKLALGTFGAFGVVVRAHLRLRAVPRADLTVLVAGTRDALLETGHRLAETAVTPACVELLSPAAAERETWLLAVRLVGTDAAVDADRAVLEGLLETRPEVARGAAAHERWTHLLASAVGSPVTLRIGADPSGLDRALDLLALHLDERVAAWITATVPTGVIRWSGDAAPEALGRFRRAAAQLEWPVTLERAPWSTLRAVGHFGAYREGVFRLVRALRAAFDPAGILVSPLDGQR